MAHVGAVNIGNPQIGYFAYPHAAAVKQHDDSPVLTIAYRIDECLDLLWRHNRWQGSSGAGIDYGRNEVRALEHMTAKEGNTLSSHLAFYAATPQCFGQVHQVLQDLVFCNLLWAYLIIVAEQIAKFA